MMGTEHSSALSDQDVSEGNNEITNNFSSFEQILHIFGFGPTWFYTIQADGLIYASSRGLLLCFPENKTDGKIISHENYRL